MLRNRDILRQIAVWIAAVATILVNGLANALPINNQQTGDIANQYKGQNLWLPAGYVFAIWGLIYVGFIAYAIFQSLPSQRENPRLRRIGWIFVVSCLANIIWLLFFHYNQFAASMVAMAVLLVCLIAIYLALRAGQPRANEFPSATAAPAAGWPVSRGERWAVWAPFSIYLGWITVATIANAAHLLVSNGWVGGPLPAAVWLLIMYVVAIALASVVTVTQRDALFLLVLVWAFVGIALNYANLTLVLVFSLLAALIVLILAILAAARGIWPSKAYSG